MIDRNNTIYILPSQVHFIDEVRAHQMKRLREWWKSRGGRGGQTSKNWQNQMREIHQKKEEDSIA